MGSETKTPMSISQPIRDQTVPSVRTQNAVCAAYVKQTCGSWTARRWWGYGWDEVMNIEMLRQQNTDVGGMKRMGLTPWEDNGRWNRLPVWNWYYIINKVDFGLKAFLIILSKKALYWLIHMRLSVHLHHSISLSISYHAIRHPIR